MTLTRALLTAGLIYGGYRLLQTIQQGPTPPEVPKVSPLPVPAAPGNVRRFPGGHAGARIAGPITRGGSAAAAGRFPYREDEAPPAAAGPIPATGVPMGAPPIGAAPETVTVSARPHVPGDALVALALVVVAGLALWKGD